jgi:hypothetical protein
VLIDLDQIADVRELTAGAAVLASAALPVGLDKLHVVRLHGAKHTTGTA